jgi:hypothetical protein
MTCYGTFNNIDQFGVVFGDCDCLFLGGFYLVDVSVVDIQEDDV